ncbi:hypothetical protein BKA70DRAFT_181893 [Coprinopsis sp. MPI-PUGE-AT-0042]|nr:hypothetical protein BKA70DRAFT_181893 [Coprinopsis sp. MPI-PUGE-AT-0042]
MSSGLPPILQGIQLPSTASSSNTIPPPPNLPLSQLEGLRLKASQIVESTQHLLYTLQGGLHPGYMPAWPEILSKYNVILSQTHNFSNALLNPYPTAGTAGAVSGGSAVAGQSKEPQENIFQKIVLHPNMGMPDMTLDMEIAPLLRNQQVMDVLKQENETVRRLSEHMNTRGMMGVLGITSEGPAPPATQQQTNGYGGRFGAPAPPAKPEYDDVLKECAEIRDAHDRRVERAVRAVHMLRERYDWKQRVEAAQEEEEVSSWNRDTSGGGGGYDEKGKESSDDEDEDEDEDEHDEEEHGDEDHVMGNGEQVEGQDDVGGDMDEEIEIDNMFVDLEVAPSTPAPAPETPKQEPGHPPPPPMNPPAPTASSFHPPPPPPPPAASVAPSAVDDDEPQIIRSNVPEIIDLT